MVLWEEEAYTRNDASGNPVTFVWIGPSNQGRKAGMDVDYLQGRIPPTDSAIFEMAMDEQERRSAICRHRVSSLDVVLWSSHLTFHYQCRLFPRLVWPIHCQSSDTYLDVRVSAIWRYVARWASTTLGWKGLRFYRYWGGLDDKSPHYPPLLRGLVNAAANIGNIIGQLSFGYLGDVFGRRFVYGNELIIGIIGIILCISLPNSIPTPNLKMAWIFCWRFVLGIGIGGDYPISAAIVSERTHLQRRGKLLGWIFSNQGWVSHCTLLAYEVIEVMHGCWEYTRFDACVMSLRWLFSWNANHLLERVDYKQHELLTLPWCSVWAFADGLE